MYDVMEGVRVVEVSEHTFAPAAGAMLADWGADVIKVERTVGGGDPQRTMRVLQRPGQKLNAFFEVANRGKRSIALDLRQAEGQAVLKELVRNADVFITNLRADAREKLGIEAANLQAINPRLIYARATGYGVRGPMASHGGFDFPSSWCRSGSVYAQTPADGGRPPQQPGSVGDLTGGATLAGAISAALFRRERTGKGAIVDHALYAMGAYIMTQSLASASLVTAEAAAAPPAPRPANPLSRLYRTRDDRWLCLCLLQDAWFPDFARRADRPDLITDPRFVTEDDKYRNAEALMAELDAVFATRTLAEWEAALFGMDGVWAPCQSPAEVIADEQARINGFVVPVTDSEGGTYYASATPGQFDERPVGELRAGPGYGQHTDEILAELGKASAQIAALREARVVV